MFMKCVISYPTGPRQIRTFESLEEFLMFVEESGGQVIVKAPDVGTVEWELVIPPTFD